MKGVRVETGVAFVVEAWGAEIIPALALLRGRPPLESWQSGSRKEAVSEIASHVPPVTESLFVRQPL